jgi:hypothetical protein
MLLNFETITNETHIRRNWPRHRCWRDYGKEQMFQ